MPKPFVEPDTSTYQGMFAANLRRLRLSRYESQEEWAAALVAEGVDVTRAAVSHWERGVRSPDVKWFPAIARTLGVKIRTLVPEDDSERRIVR